MVIKGNIVILSKVLAPMTLHDYYPVGRAPKPQLLEVFHLYQLS